jgi:hypothetical protein
MPIPDDFLDLLPQVGLGYNGPVYHLWAFDPVSGDVKVEENESKHPAQAITHEDMKTLVSHPSAEFGYAYRIKGGWRITDSDHRPVTDPFIVNKLLKTLS